MGFLRSQSLGAAAAKAPSPRSLLLVFGLDSISIPETLGFGQCGRDFNTTFNFVGNVKKKNDIKALVSLRILNKIYNLLNSTCHPALPPHSLS